MNTSKKLKLKSKNLGFTFVELIIVLSIFAVLSGVVLFNFTDFSSNVKLQNLVQDVALQIRQAQLSGSSGRMFPQVTIGNSTFIPPGLADGTIKYAYGVHFDFDTDITQNTQFIYFADFDPLDPGVFDGSSHCEVISYPNEECIDILSLPPEFVISEIEITDIGGASRSAIAGDFSSLDITFTRPKLEASIIADGDTNALLITDVKITLKSSREQERTVLVSHIGQISAE
jgi:prepilin-type N-terminal cleavage/methylation domain-containing protein